MKGRKQHKSARLIILLGKDARGMHVTALKEDTCPLIMKTLYALQKILIYSMCMFVSLRDGLPPDIVSILGGTAVIIQMLIIVPVVWLKPNCGDFLLPVFYAGRRESYMLKIY